MRIQVQSFAKMSARATVIHPGMSAIATRITQAVAFPRPADCRGMRVPMLLSGKWIGGIARPLETSLDADSAWHWRTLLVDFMSVPAWPGLRLMAGTPNPQIEAPLPERILIVEDEENAGGATRRCSENGVLRSWEWKAPKRRSRACLISLPTRSSRTSNSPG